MLIQIFTKILNFEIRISVLNILKFCQRPLSFSLHFGGSKHELAIARWVFFQGRESFSAKVHLDIYMSIQNIHLKISLVWIYSILSSTYDCLGQVRLNHPRALASDVAHSCVVVIIRWEQSMVLMKRTETHKTTQLSKSIRGFSVEKQPD